jgi:fucose permease
MNAHSPAVSHRLVRRCCYLGMFIQAMVINLTPLFFIPLRQQFDLSFEQLGRLVLINFVTQMVVDLVCTAVVDRFGLIKPLIVLAQLFSAAGLWLFAAAPLLFPHDPYTGLLLGTVVFSLGCGLVEVLVSPIINALPAERKEGQMALLHAFYPIGKVGVIALTALALTLFGDQSWGWIALGWSIIPLFNLFGFAAVQLPEFVHESRREKTRTMARSGAFWLGLFAIFLAGAAEVTFAQWTSAFARAALGLSQLVADWVGFGLFGAMMILGRLWFGWHGHNVPLRPLLIISALLSALCYIVVGICPWPVVSLLACILAGLFVSMLWPGVVSLSAARFPQAGISLFALLAAFGDTGAGLMPWLVGVTADAVERTLSSGGVELSRMMQTLTAVLPGAETPEQAGLRAGLLLAAIGPALMVGVLLLFRPPSTAERKATIDTEAGQ